MEHLAGIYLLGFFLVPDAISFAAWLLSSFEAFGLRISADAFDFSFLVAIAVYLLSELEQTEKVRVLPIF